jgi:hypothetical protein
LKLGFVKPLESEDLFEMPSKGDPTSISDIFQRKWEEELRKNKQE